MTKPRKRASDVGVFLAFVLPATLLVLFAFYGPFVMNVFYSFTSWNGIQKAAQFNGLENFAELLTDADFGASVVFTLAFAVVFMGLSNVLGIFLANLLDKNLFLKDALRAVLFIPYILSLVVVGFIWNFLLGSGFSSLAALTNWEVFRLDFLGNRHLVFWTVALVSVWQSIGFYVVIYHAGLQTIPPELLEAATLDGAGSHAVFYRIKLPLLAASLTSGLFFSLAASIRVYDVIVSLTRGGPGTATNSVTFDIYKEAFLNNRYGYGTAKSLVLLAVVFALSVIQLRFFKNREVAA